MVLIAFRMCGCCVWRIKLQPMETVDWQHYLSMWVRGVLLCTNENSCMGYPSTNSSCSCHILPLHMECVLCILQVAARIPSQSHDLPTFSMQPGFLLKVLIYPLSIFSPNSFQVFLFGRDLLSLMAPSLMQN